MVDFGAFLRKRLVVLTLSLAATAISFTIETSSAKADENGAWFAASFTSDEAPRREHRAGISRSGRSSLGRYTGDDRPARARRGRSGVRYAALGTTPSFAPTGPSITGGVRWAASSSCLNSTLRSVVAAMASFGSVTVNSTCRSRSRNARVGGARHSYHLGGNAADFRVRGNVRAAFSYLRSSGSVGGIKHYGGGLFHIDTGPRRRW